VKRVKKNEERTKEKHHQRMVEKKREV